MGGPDMAPQTPQRSERPGQAGALLYRLIGLVVVLALLGVAAAALAADPCAHRGKLDPLYCDENRDLVADPPKDRARFVNPDTLIFSYVPVEDPAVYEGAWSEFLAHLGRVTGKKTKYFGLQNYAAQIEAMRSGRLHVGGFAAGSVSFAVNLAGGVPFTVMSPDGQKPLGYQLIVLVAAKNDRINSVADLRGKRVAHVSQTSNSGHQAPVYFFSKLGVVPGKDYQIVFSGKHDTSALGVVNGDYDAAPVASGVIDRMAARGVIKRSDYKVVYTSPTFPTTGYLHAHNLDPRLVEKIREAFLGFKIPGTSLAKEFKNVIGFSPIAYAKDWEPVVAIQEANGVVYSKESDDYKKLHRPVRD
jgi:phosphonate transport system substrate-binding protein